MSVIRHSRTEATRFTVARKGYDTGQVERYAAAIEASLAQAQGALGESRARISALEQTVRDYEDREDELNRPLRVSAEAGQAIVAHAEVEAAARLQAADAQAAELLAAGRAQLAREARELDKFRMAIAAEAADLAAAEERLKGTISRAAAALVQIVDGTGGLGPFSQGTGSLIEFGRLLLAAANAGALGEVRIELEGDVASATLVASAGGEVGRPSAPTGAGPQAEAGVGSSAVGAAPVAPSTRGGPGAPTAPTAPTDGGPAPAPVTPELSEAQAALAAEASAAAAMAVTPAAELAAQANAANSSSMAFN